MKSILKYVSLLIFSGLIIPFCYQFKGADKSVNLSNAQSINKLAPGKNDQPASVWIIKELAKSLTPILKSENNL